jgi:NAD+ kinase
MPAVNELRQIGMVVHPTRDVAAVLGEIESWATAEEVAVGQIPTDGQSRRLAEPVHPTDCDLVLALGGDGTSLIALHTGAPIERPVLGVACGSVGVLTSVHADRVRRALEQVAEGRFEAEPVPALEIEWEGGRGVAINDLVVVRDGPGQVLVAVHVDGELYVRVAGDGLIVATELGSSAYNMAAGGPILAPAVDAIAVTPLATHGGSTPPLVAARDSRLDLEVEPGYGGVRYELDGRPADVRGHELSVARREAYAKLVTLADEEPRFTGLRRRGLLLDSPRVLVRDKRPDNDAEHRPV